jgi:DNA-directed RNA polymerase specialized sigma24 family protein
MGMCSLETQLEQWAIAAGRCPIGSLERQQYLTYLLSAAGQSRQLWRGIGLDPDDYDEALQQTWLYVCRRIEVYDPKQAGVMTWINSHLKWRIKDIAIARAQERQQKVAVDSPPDRVSQIPARPTAPGLLADIHHWLEQEGPRLQRIHIQRHPNIHCQMLIQQRLLLERPWKDLSSTHAVPISTLSSFFQLKCLPPLRQFVLDVMSV